MWQAFLVFLAKPLCRATINHLRNEKACCSIYSVYERNGTIFLSQLRLLLVLPLLLPGQVIAQLKVPSPRPVAIVGEQPYSEAGTLFPYVKISKKPSYDDAILRPFHAKQAEAKAARDAQSALKATQEPQVAQTPQATPAAVTAAPVKPQEVTIAAPTDVTSVIYHWANVYGVPPEWALNIATCESTLNPRASNGTHFGIYQFSPSTYYAYSGAAGAGSDYWDVNNNVRVALYMLARGQINQWECKG